MMLNYYLAAATTGSSDIIGVFLQYGALGAIAVVLGFYAKNLIKREQDRADRQDRENTRLNTLIQEKTIPALVVATQAVQDSQKTMEDLRRQKEIDDEIIRRSPPPQRKRRPDDE